VYAIIKEIEEDHLVAAELVIGREAANILQATKAEIRSDCERLNGLLKAAMVLAEVYDHTTDRLLAIGRDIIM
jgi:hypothetical protein